MSHRKSAHPVAGNSVSPSREQIVTGDELLLPLVKRVAVVWSQRTSRITWHAHQTFELLFVLDGGTAYEFAGGQTVELPGGHFLVVPPGMSHRGLHDVRQPVRLCGIMFDPQSRVAERHSPFTLADLRRLRVQCAAGAMQVWRMKPEVRRLVRSLLQLLSDAQPRAEFEMALVRSTICATLLEVARQLAAPRSLGPNLAAKAAIAFLNEHLTEPVSMDLLARAAHCSRARLFCIFKESTGLTPNDYLQRLRVQRAQQALIDTDRSVTDIALDCGFSSSQYFSSVFRKYAGVTPTEFRIRQTVAPSLATTPMPG